MSSLALCIHGHFYQPPREDPLTGLVPHEPGAAPYSNWNERILAECYRPNIEQRNLEKISFNFGSTLISWMSGYDPSILKQIVAQDRANVQKFGVGNAMAQPYNHTILPLSNYRDKVTQVYWGIEDFKARFGRQPRGMWLPESAVDTETLLVLADHGIEYTILAPWQAKTQNLDPTEPYWVSLPGKKRIIVFFYQGDLSGRISFEPGITVNADYFARDELLQHYNQEKIGRGENQLLCIATDGELYGHHKAHRDLFLKHLMNGAASSNNIKITFPSLWLREHPPRHTIALNYETSWSCFHGLSRWSTGCDCTPGDSSWKKTFREAMNQIGVAIDEVYFDYVRHAINDPWKLRNDFIEVILKQKTAPGFILENSNIPLDQKMTEHIHWLLEAQFERQRMFTSCGWFFEDLNRIEPKNNIAYAAQAVWMTYEATGIDLSSKALKLLSPITSQDGRIRADQIFMKHLVRAQTSHRIMPNR
jgi:alpha-amylase/alpha-mannosidase (GH57 family)